MKLVVPIVALALGACTTIPQDAEPPFVATFAESIPNMIVLAAGSDGTLHIREGCVLWRYANGDRATVIPIFEPGVTTGVDERGYWLRDPGEERLFRDGDRVSAAGVGPNDRSFAQIEHTRPLAEAVPTRCLGLTTDPNPRQIGPPLHHGHILDRARRQ